MIIGDGIVLGSGGEAASIIVTAPTGSTVTCTTPGGVVLTATEVSGTWKFAKLKVYGTYTVTATYGTKTATQDVLVDSAMQYDIELSYKLWLYRGGDECDAVTGGWGQVNWWSSSSSLIKNTDNINVYCPSGGYSCAAVTVNKVDLTQYSKITINVLESVVNSTGWNSLIILNNRTAPDTASNRARVINIYGKTGELSTDISSITGSWYVGVYVNSQSKGECYIKFNNVWLE